MKGSLHYRLLTLGLCHIEFGRRAAHARGVGSPSSRARCPPDPTMTVPPRPRLIVLMYHLSACDRRHWPVAVWRFTAAKCWRRFRRA